MTTPTPPPGDRTAYTFTVPGRVLDDEFDFVSRVWLWVRYDPSDPYAIQVDGLNYPTQVPDSPWTVSRELLLLPVLWGQPTGLGDFRAYPVTIDHWNGRMELPCLRLAYHASHEADVGMAVRYVDVTIADMEPHVQQILRAVPLGSEHKHHDIDRTIDQLLSRNYYWEA